MSRSSFYFITGSRKMGSEWIGGKYATGVKWTQLAQSRDR
jgi:hypothetical protein